MAKNYKAISKVAGLAERHGVKHASSVRKVAHSLGYGKKGRGLRLAGSGLKLAGAGRRKRACPKRCRRRAH